MEAALGVLRGAAVEADLFPTDSPTHAAEETRRAVDAGLRYDFCLRRRRHCPQHHPGPRKLSHRVGILPMGTANALAHDISLPLNVVAAAKAALSAAPRRIALGRVKLRDMKEIAEPIFRVAAGVGVDAHLFYKLHTGAKQKMACNAYYAKRWHMWWTYPMTRFVAEYSEAASKKLLKLSDVTSCWQSAFETLAELFGNSLPVLLWIGKTCAWSSVAHPAGRRILRM